MLLYLQTSMSTYADGTSEQSSCVIERTMARCRSNECLWREKTWPVESLDRWDSYAERAPLSELMCEYRSHDQTFRMSRPTSRNPPEPVDAAEARREALYRLPFLAPPAGPMTVGFEWRGEAGEDHMNFRLEAEKRVKETSVLVIRREGRYTTWLPSGPESADAGSTRVPVVVHRRGLTLFAWKRGAVLEDRSLDCVLDPGARRPDGGGAGSTHRVLRLLSSRPVND